MKRVFAYLVPVLIFSFALCGCGRDRVENDTVINTPVVTPMVSMSPSPSIMPDINDGEVKDEDGIIEEDEMNSPGNSSSPAPSTPTPSATTKP